MMQRIDSLTQQTNIVANKSSKKGIHFREAVIYWGKWMGIQLFEDYE